MRTIKFRAWIEKCKSMLEGVTIYQTMIGLSDEHFEEDLNPDFEFDGEVVWRTGEDPEEVLSPMLGEEWIFFDEDYVLEQFTGLKDKNGTEIYEGDIFREEKETDTGDIRTYNVVMWIEQRAAFYLIPSDHYQVIRDNDVSNEEGFDWLFQDANLYDFSIDVGLPLVGNIHENQKLLDY